MLNRRKSPRRKMVLSIKGSVDKVAQLAHTVDITPTGARINCTLRTRLQPGTIIGVQLGSRKTEFRVQWIESLARMNNRSASNRWNRRTTFGASICLTTLRPRETRKHS
jgi:hypothetical protein